MDRCERCSRPKLPGARWDHERLCNQCTGRQHAPECEQSGTSSCSCRVAHGFRLERRSKERV